MVKQDMHNKRVGYPGDRLGYIRALNSRLEGLDQERVEECKEAMWSAYIASAISTKVAEVKREKSTQPDGLKSIGLWSSIELDKFNARDYYWKPYFSDVGRAISNGERKYLHNRIGRRLRGDKETISRSNPNFAILTDRIKNLNRNSQAPDILFAPIKIFVDFVKFYDSSIDWSHGRPEQLLIEDCRLKIFWSHKYAQLNSFVIFNSKAGIWHVMPDQETGRAVTIALGKSSQMLGRVEYWIETLVRYEMLDTRAFCRINLSR